MPIMNFGGSDSDEDLNEQFAEITKLLNFLLNGMLDVANIRAKSLTAEVIKAGSITADEMTVNELSAISANLGTILAGFIYGTYIATANGTYPRAEMSNTDDLFGAYSAINKYIQIKSLDGTTSTPSMIFNDDSISVSAQLYIDDLNNEFNIGSKGDMQISASPNNLKLNGEIVYVPSWDQVVNAQTGQTLYNALLSGPT